MEKFLTDNSAAMKCARTAIQGLLGVLVAYLPQMLDLWHLDPVISGVIVAAVAAVSSPFMALLGERIA